MVVGRQPRGSRARSTTRARPGTGGAANLRVVSPPVPASGERSDHDLPSSGLFAHSDISKTLHPNDPFRRKEGVKRSHRAPANGREAQ